jgi:hypothetical protein
MHDVLRQRLWRHIEALPEEQLYQALDYIEFLSSKYARDAVRPAASPLQRFGERLEDKMRGQRLGFRTIRGTLEAMGSADRVVSGIADAGRTIWREVEEGLRVPNETEQSRREPKPAADAEAPRALPPGDRPDDPLTRI